MKSFPIKINMYFESGDPSGICEVWMDNFNGIVYKIPRTFLNESSIKSSINVPGFYFLIGTVNQEKRVYIGEGEDVLERLKTHNLKEDKDWFSEVIVVTSERNYLNKAKIKYLENTFYNIAKAANRYIVEQTNPTKSKLGKSEEGTLLEFIEKTKVLVTALGYKIFEGIEQKQNDESFTTFYFRKGTEKQATGHLHPEGFVVSKGSYVRPEEAPKLYSWIKETRKNNKDKIVNSLLTEDILLNSPSLAVNFVAGTVGSGNQQWKTADGITLGEYLESKK